MGQCPWNLALGMLELLLLAKPHPAILCLLGRPQNVAEQSEIVP